MTTDTAGSTGTGAFGRNLSANLLANVWLTGLMLIATPAYLHFLGVESYGLVGFYVSCVAIVSILDTGISATATRETAWLAASTGRSREIPALFRSLEVAYWCIVILIGGLLLLLAYAVGDTWFQPHHLAPRDVQEALALMAIALICQVPCGLYVAGLMGLQHQAQCAGLLALFGTLRAVGAVLVLWTIRPDIQAFFIWQIVCSLLQTGTMRVMLWRRFHHTGGAATFSLRSLRSVHGLAGLMIGITALSALITQGDKMILSRLVSLEALGSYMLAWAVAGALTRFATPLMQTFGPRFTQLVANGDAAGLAAQTRAGCELMNVLVLPPAALLVFLAEPLLHAWTGDKTLAAATAPVMVVMTIGTGLASCSYSALGVLYSRGDARYVFVFNVFAVLILFPVLILATMAWGVLGAAGCWALYGGLTYLSYQYRATRGMPRQLFMQSLVRDFGGTLLLSLLGAGMTAMLLSKIETRLVFVAAFLVALSICWLAAALASQTIRGHLTGLVGRRPILL